MRRHYQLPEHITVVDASAGIIGLDTTDLSNELRDRATVLAHRLAEELELPSAYVEETLHSSIEEMTLLTLFKGTRDITNAPVQPCRQQ